MRAALNTTIMAKIIKGLLNGLLRTCRLQVSGVDNFINCAQLQPCVLALWHNRLAIMPFILANNTPAFVYTALVSASRDADFLHTFIHTYKNGRTIRVGHLTRHEGLRAAVRTIEAYRSILVITPDGPRGPRYQAKPGLALAAIQTGAMIFPVNWEADRCWELNSWDGLRIPKPFAKIKVQFEAPLQFDKSKAYTRLQVQEILQDKLSAR